MKSYLYLFISLYILIFSTTLYGLIYEEIGIVIPGLLSLVVLLIIVFMFNSYSLKSKYEIDENVLHLTREILHELNIPISTIQANVSLIERQAKGEEKLLKRLSRIRDASERLEHLYEELHYSIKKEIREVEREEIEVGGLVKERVAIMQQLHRNPFALELEECRVFVDKIGFEKMLENILTNAMKYSSKEREITIGLKDTSLIVKDEGIGMDEETLSQIDKRYYRFNKKTKGEGIGLALVYAYCKDEKITIEIRSKKGEGTEVVLGLKNVIV